MRYLDAQGTRAPWAPRGASRKRYRCLSAQSDYQDASVPARVSKSIVSGLTAAVKFVVPPQQSFLAEAEAEDGSFAPEQVREAISLDYTEKCYLWTGEISDKIYAADCVFTDPTLSFTGLATFKRNLASLRPLMDALLSETDVELYSCSLESGDELVQADWRMTGSFKLPWKPVLDLRGTTRFTMDPDRGNRVIRYDESWGMTASEALMMLFKPGRKPVAKTGSDEV